MAESPPKALLRALTHAESWIGGLGERPIQATATIDELRRRLGVGLQDRGLPADQVIDELVAATEGGHLGSASGRFFAWVIGGSLESALAADWLTSTWDQNAALYACGPAASVVEEVAGSWLKDLLGLPTDASFAFTTGCQLAHVTCLAAARQAVLQGTGWDVNVAGLFGSPRIRVITSEHRHGSIDRAVRFLGIGSENLFSVATDRDGRITNEALGSMIRVADNPTIVVLDAADLNIAAFDPFDELIPLAKSLGAWVHIDGAFGLFARASRAKAPLLSGVELADSWATDGHKWLNVPFDCGIAFVRDRAAHRAAMTVSASYIAADDEARDQIDWNPEWSRRSRGFAVYAALRELGREGIESLIDRSCAHAAAIVEGVAALPGVEVVWKPTLNQGLLRFRDLSRPADERAHDRRTDEVIAAINRSGEAFFSSTTWRGRRAMRVSVVNWRTTERDVKRAVACIGKVLG